MSILVVGSVAFDTIATPFGRAERALGGSATYFSLAASFFAPVQLVAVVGDDFGDDEMAVFAGKSIDLEGLVRKPGSTFTWSGTYGYDLNVAETLDTQLNVFADFAPRLPEGFRDADVVFLANIDPELQSDVLDQVQEPRLVVLDTMNYWIDSKRDALIEIMSRVDLIVINEAEVRQLTGRVNLVQGARAMLDLGPRVIVIKRGEYGVLMISAERIFAAPAYPLETVFDPTGAGDSFAGGLLGYLAACSRHGDREMRRGIIYGSVVASFNVEDFSVKRLQGISRTDIDERFAEFKRLTHFELVEEL